VVVLDLDDRLLRIQHAVIHDRVDLHRDVIAGDHILGRHVEYQCAQIDPYHLLDARNHQDQPWSLDLPEAAEHEHHAAFVFAQDAKGRSQQAEQQHQQHQKTHFIAHGSAPLVGGWLCGDLQLQAVSGDHSYLLADLQR